jgi:hypothetical protein
MSLQGQVRFCACGTRLASDNPGVRCGPCQRGRSYGLGALMMVLSRPEKGTMLGFVPRRDGACCPPPL